MCWKASGLLLATILCAGCATPPAALFAPAGKSVRVVTYNINYGMANPDAVVEALRTADADVVCLQETQPQWEQLLKLRLGAIYRHSYFVTSGGAGGIAILSKQELHEARVWPVQAGWFPALSADVETPLGRVQILNVHLRPPLSVRGAPTPSALFQSPKIHRAELREFLLAMDKNSPLIVAGDFNENEDDGGAGLLRREGFTDALSLFDRRTRTWEWRLAPGLWIRRRYDHLLFNAQLNCTGARVETVHASDHMPVIAEFTARRP